MAANNQRTITLSLFWLDNASG
jgi:hypothetical protein